MAKAMGKPMMVSKKAAPKMDMGKKMMAMKGAMAKGKKK